MEKNYDSWLQGAMPSKHNTYAGFSRLDRAREILPRPSDYEWLTE